MAGVPASASLPPGLELPEEVLAVLPVDPFDQLDLARKITSIALASRVAALEDEVSDLHRALAEREQAVDELRSQLDALDSSLVDVSNQLARTEDEKEALQRENASLSSTVKKLNRDVAKLEVFRKTLMQSLQDEDENAKAGAVQKILSQPSNVSIASVSSLDEEPLVPSFKLPAVRTHLSETGSVASDDTASVDADVPRPAKSYVVTPYNITPQATPPDSPTKFSSISPRRHSISFANARNEYGDRSSVSSSLPSSRHSSVSGLPETESQAGRSRVDGKEFFRQVRNRLSYQQFSSFLANVKDLNSHKQSREEALRKADEIFGPDNKDLYAIFEGLIARKL